MSIIKVNKRTVGPTLAKNDNDGRDSTVDVGNNCSVGGINGGFGGACNVGSWEVTATCNIDRSCQVGVSRSYDC